ncbi:hypothetical protein QBC32DRAFT_205350, partial [Pseudoneurospora amorphoporcata]
LPAKIKLMVYRYAWTVDATPDKYKESYDQDGKRYTHHLRDEYLKDELKAIHTLGFTCKEIRNHVYQEYFTKSQFHIQCWAEPWRKRRGPEIRNHILTMKVAQKSVLLRNYLQHVQVRFGPIFDEEMLNAELESIEWLATLKQLKSLTIKIAPFPYQNGIDPLLYKPPRLQHFHHYSKRREALMSLPRLQKLLFYVEDLRYLDCAMETPWVQDFMKALYKEIGPAPNVCGSSFFPSINIGSPWFSMRTLTSKI